MDKIYNLSDFSDLQKLFWNELFVIVVGQKFVMLAHSVDSNLFENYSYTFCMLYGSK
jgi:hypothetical protein